MRIASILVFSAVIATAAAACGSAKDRHEVTPALQEILAAKPIVPVEPAVWADVAAFYEKRAATPAWIDEPKENSTARATKAVELLHTAPAHGLEGDYGDARIAELPALIKKLDKKSPERLQQLAELDVRITTALLAFGRDVALGHSRPEAIDPRWKSQRATPDFAGTLNTAVNGDLDDWLDSIRPQHPEYIALQKALADVEGQEKKGGWVQVSNQATLRQRLAASGELKGDDLAAGVRSFQELHAIKATGSLDAATRAAMNVPIEERLSQIRVNLERWRWAPDDFGTDYFLVNIPFFHLIAFENRKPVMDIRVVVGKAGHETPIFSDEMESVVFSPYWNIPDAIAEGETAPAVGRDPNYLAKNNIEVLRVSNKQVELVDPSHVNWDDPKELRGLAFRQRPGSNNALGQVKFLFPNAFDVYLHDTPADALFSRQSRAFSHGCVRVEEPEKLAHYVLRDDKDWNVEQMNAAMRSGEEKYVTLKSKIPVHIVYFTAWVDEGGGVHFQPDIYGYDKKQRLQKS
ncbi:MAG: L,D-transpeptidase family protein [Vicinamibacterales bacterium]